MGEFVSLSPLVWASDAEALFAISHADELAREIYRYLPSGPFADASAMSGFLKTWSESVGVLAFVTRRKGTDEVLGTLSLMNIRPEHGVAEIGNVWYSPAAQRTKVNTESVYLLLRHCFEDLGYRRMEWKCDRRNRGSAIAAQRLGFTYEGTFRKHMLVKGENRDTAWFAMLDEQWPAKSKDIKSWLYIDDHQPLGDAQSRMLPY